MAKLSVNDQIFKYKDTTYQIGQIVSVRKYEIKLKPQTIDPEKRLIPAKLFGFASLLLVTMCALIYFEITSELDEYFLYFIAGLIFSFLMFIRNSAARHPTILQRSMHKFEIMLPNGRKEVFESSNKNTIDKITDAIDQAINKKGGVSLQMTDVNVQISNSDNLVFGSSINER